MDDMEVIDMLASDGIKAECANVYREDLPEEGKILFERVWDDENPNLEEDFELLFNTYGVPFAFVD